MILVWLIAWWLENTPPCHPWNTWFVTLIIAAILV